MPQQNNLNLKTFYRNIISNSALLLPHQFVVTFDGARLPDALKSDANDPACLTYYIKTAKIPDIQIKETSITFMAQDFKIPGGVQYGNSWDVKVLMTGDLLQYKRLYAWQEEFATLKNSGGASSTGSRLIPNVNAHVKLLDATMQEELHEFTLVGIFPTKIPDLSMKYEQNSTITDFSCTFTYQYMYRDDEGDPLQA